MLARCLKVSRIGWCAIAARRLFRASTVARQITDSHPVNVGNRTYSTVK